MFFFVKVRQLNETITNYEELLRKTQADTTKDEVITKMSAEITRLNTEVAKWARSHVRLIFYKNNW